MRDLNKSYKKIDSLRWHKEKAFIRMFCAFSCAILLIILLLMFPIVSDADNPKISDYYFIKDILKLSDAVSHNGESGYYSVDGNIFNEPTFLSNDSMNYYEQLQGVWYCDFPSGIGSNYNMTVYVSTNNEVKVIFAGQSVALNYDSNYNYLTPPSIFGDSPIVYKYENNSLTYIGYLDGGSYKNINDCNFILYTTMSINMYYQNADRNLNYLLIEGNVGKGSGGFDVTPNYPEESADNNLVFNQSDFIFTHQTYYAPYSSSINTGSAVPVGTISFKGQPNNYQLEHSSEFELQFTFSFDYNVNYKNYNSAVGYFKQTNSILGNQKNLKLNIVNNVPITVSLSNFINNKNQYSIDIKSVFDSLLIDNNTSLSGLLAQSKEITELSYNQFLITCNARLVSNGKSSGSYTENYNFNSRKGLTTDKSIEDNSNPYVPNPSDQANDDPDSTNIQPTPNVPGPGGSDDGGSSGGSSSSAQANPNIVINNNPTFNNNPSASASASADGSGNLLSKLIDTLFGAGNVQEGSIGGHTQQQLITNTGASRWFQVANDSMSWIPASVWSELLMFLGITLGILVVAFILRVILDFL